MANPWRRRERNFRDVRHVKAEIVQAEDKLVCDEDDGVSALSKEDLARMFAEGFPEAASGGFGHRCVQSFKTHNGESIDQVLLRGKMALRRCVADAQFAA